MDKKIAVLGDVHGELENLVGALESLDADRLNGNPDDGWHIIQLGDFLHLGHKKPEYEFYVNSKGLIDEHLIGNHEYPVLGGPKFWGYQDKDVKAYHAFKDDLKETPWRVATSVGDWLITHAGLHAKLVQKYFVDMTASEIAADLNKRFYDRAKNEQSHYELFDAIDHWRGGMDTPGSVLWGDFKMLMGSYQHVIQRVGGVTLPKQIVGHTPQSMPKNPVDGLWAIDVGGGIGVLVTEDNGQSWEPSYVKDEDSRFVVTGDD